MGIKTSFITDYMHTVVTLVVIFLFAFSAYVTNATLGSPGKVYDTVVAASRMHPVEGNAQGELFDDAVQGGRDFLDDGGGFDGVAESMMSGDVVVSREGEGWG